MCVKEVGRGRKGFGVAYYHGDRLFGIYSHSPSFGSSNYAAKKILCADNPFVPKTCQASHDVLKEQLLRYDVIINVFLDTE